MSKKHYNLKDLEFPDEKEEALKGATFPEFEEPLASMPEPVSLPVAVLPVQEMLTEDELLRAMADSIADNSALISLLETYEAQYPSTLWKAVQQLGAPGPNAKQARKTTLGAWKINDWGKR